MKAGWQKVRLGDVCEKITSGGTPLTKKSEYYINGKIPWLRTQEVDFRRIYETELKITELGLNNSSAKYIPANSVILAMYGATAGKSAITKIPLTTNQACCNLIIDNKKADYEYVYYYIKNNYSKLLNLANGGAQQNLNAGIISGYPLILPPLPTQRAIAATLSCLDDKIALNRRINANLEAQVQALFKSWFVDFEPFKDGDFVDSELGRIPKGWRVGTLADVCEKITKGTTPTTLKRNFTSFGIHFVKAESINNDHSFDISKFAYIDEETNKLLERSIIKKDDILFTMAGTIGRFAYVTDAILPANTNQAIAIIRTDPAIINPKVIYSYLIGGWHKQYYFEKIQQAVQANLSLGNIGSLPLLLPPKNELSEYTSIIIPILDMIQYNINQSRTITVIRDTLLPRLMSGEIEVEEK